MNISLDPALALNLFSFLSEFFAALPLNAASPSEDRPSTTAAGGTPTLALLSVPLHLTAPDGTAIRTEWVVYDGPAGTVKVQFWHGDDRAIPHNHPWRDQDDVSFHSYIIRGGYTEDVWTRTVDIDDGWELDTYFHGEGDKVTCMADEFHRVRDVLPGTVTVMFCGPRKRVEDSTAGAQWGYLIPETFEVVPPTDLRVSDPTFGDRLKTANPHKR